MQLIENNLIYSVMVQISIFLVISNTILKVNRMHLIKIWWHNISSMILCNLWSTEHSYIELILILFFINLLLVNYKHQKEYSQECPCKNVFDEMSLVFGPGKDVLRIKCPWEMVLRKKCPLGRTCSQEMILENVLSMKNDQYLMNMRRMKMTNIQLMLTRMRMVHRHPSSLHLQTRF